MRIMRPPGDLTDGLIKFITDLPPNLVMAEIGCYAGESTALFAAKAPKVYCVDPWQTYTERFFETHGAGSGGVILDDLAEAEAAFDLVAARFPNVVKLKLTSAAAALQFPVRSLDLVYIDANHEYECVLANIKEWLPKLRPGGFLSGHDYVFLGPRRAVTETIGRPDATYVDGSWIFRLPSEGPSHLVA